jgi:flagellar protein FlaJ
MEGYNSELKEAINKEIKIIRELGKLFKDAERKSPEEKTMINSHASKLTEVLRITSDEVSSILEDMSVVKPLSINVDEPKIKIITPAKTTTYAVKNDESAKKKPVSDKLSEIEIMTLKRLKRKKKSVMQKKIKKPSKYVAISSRMFGKQAASLSKKDLFLTLKRDLVKAHLEFIPENYISAILFTTFLVFVISFIAVIFLLFLNIGIDYPFITKVAEGLGARFLKVFWVFLVFPIATSIIMYFYPSMEKKYIENKINQELPFATIHMSAISGALVEPSKVFSIIISTKEYPYLERELTKLINEINVYGYDLVTALRNVSFNCPSARLAELLNGIGTTITSGGSLQDFFDKRSQSLLLEYRLERESYTKTAETFMDIYISLVIAAPMILMLLLIMMRVSGLGVTLSTSMITLVIVLGVAMINAIFLMFLQLKQPQA